MKISRNLIILIIFLAFLAALFLGRQIFFPPQEKLQVLNTTPSFWQTNVPLNQEIVLEFNQVVNPQDFTFSPFPKFSLKTKGENKEIIITPTESLFPNTQYQLEVKNKTGNSFFSLVFQTTKEEVTPTPSPDLLPSLEATAGGKGDPNALEEMTKKLYQNYPLYDLTPHRTPIWVADYAAPKKLTVFYKTGKNLPLIQEEVFNWIRENKIDPKTHLYIWEEREILP